jgi:serine/threonine protein kinase
LAIFPGASLGRYEIRSLIGKGSMGEVYLAYDTQLRRQVAVKILTAEFTQNKLRLSRFEREAYAASSLNHPNILTIHKLYARLGEKGHAFEWLQKAMDEHSSRLIYVKVSPTFDNMRSDPTFVGLMKLVGLAP